MGEISIERTLTSHDIPVSIVRMKYKPMYFKNRFIYRDNGQEIVNNNFSEEVTRHLVKFEFATELVYLQPENFSDFCNVSKFYESEIFRQTNAVCDICGEGISYSVHPHDDDLMAFHEECYIVLRNDLISFIKTNSDIFVSEQVQNL